MKKNIFIAGVARSGKSTLSEKLCKNLNYNHFPLDYITSSLKKNFPECNINSNVIINHSSKKLSLLLSTIFNIIDSKEEKFIIDSAHIMPKDIMEYINLDNWDVYYLGYPDVSPEEKFNEIRKYDTEADWTSKRTDEDLLDTIEKLIHLSKDIEHQCQELGITFINTSENLVKTINKKYKEIKKKAE